MLLKAVQDISLMTKNRKKIKYDLLKPRRGDVMVKILITGQNGYISKSLKKILMTEPEKYIVDTISLRNNDWKNYQFDKYDVVVHLAGLVHHKEKKSMKKCYFDINSKLTKEIALKSKKSRVSQFIFMSTMAVYGEVGDIGKDLVINRDTPFNPKSYYALSKVEAEYELEKLKGTDFIITILRPPMIYGKDCPGNYALLRKIAKYSPIFPLINNKRSMLHIDKLCQVIIECINKKIVGVILPQDDEYLNTSFLVKEIAKKEGRNILLSRKLGKIILLIGRSNSLIKKVFGNLVYDRDDLNKGIDL